MLYENIKHADAKLCMIYKCGLCIGTKQSLISNMWNQATAVCFPTREEGYLTDEQPAVCKVEFAAEDLSRPAAKWEGDGSWRGVLQIFEGNRQGERRRGPGLKEARLEKTLYFAEDSDALCVAVVTVHLGEHHKCEPKSTKE